jgi:hypothetical protein
MGYLMNVVGSGGEGEQEKYWFEWKVRNEMTGLESDLYEISIPLRKRYGSTIERQKQERQRWIKDNLNLNGIQIQLEAKKSSIHGKDPDAFSYTGEYYIDAPQEKKLTAEVVTFEFNDNKDGYWTCHAPKGWASQTKDLYPANGHVLVTSAKRWDGASLGGGGGRRTMSPVSSDLFRQQMSRALRGWLHLTGGVPPTTADLQRLARHWDFLYPARGNPARRG